MELFTDAPGAKEMLMLRKRRWENEDPRPIALELRVPSECGPMVREFFKLATNNVTEKWTGEWPSTYFDAAGKWSRQGRALFGNGVGVIWDTPCADNQFDVVVTVEYTKRAHIEFRQSETGWRLRLHGDFVGKKDVLWTFMSLLQRVYGPGVNPAADDD